MKTSISGRKKLFHNGSSCLSVAQSTGLKVPLNPCGGQMFILPIDMLQYVPALRSLLFRI